MLRGKGETMDRLSLRQFIVITFLIGLAMKMFNLPVLMLRFCGRDAFVVLLIEAAADFILLGAVIAIIVCARGKTLFMLLEDAFGAIVSRIITIAVGLFWLLKLFIMLVDVRIFFSNTVFNAPLGAVHVLPLIVLLVYFALKPLSGAGRLGELFTPAVVISMALLGALTVSKVDFGGLRPLLADGSKPVTDGLSSLFMWFGDFTLLLMATGKADGGKKLFFALPAGIAAFACMTLFSAVLFASYGDMPELLSYGHSISNITQYAVGSFKFGRFDLLIFAMWLSAVFVSSGIIAAFFARCMNYVFGGKVGRVMLVAGGAAVYIATMFTVNLNTVTELAMVYFNIPAAVVQYGLPVLCVVALTVTRIKRRKNEINEKAPQ